MSCAENRASRLQQARACLPNTCLKLGLPDFSPRPHLSSTLCLVLLRRITVHQITAHYGPVLSSLTGEARAHPATTATANM